ncbi:class I SAM-dependent methyltransferase [Clostridium sp. PL3]|uniref:Class I SAM-dependent methyltransferase n=1 Tax=Clostridium thailandense TaxID=2794346 RepID=A0A949WTH7_9CLOT|nr:class I SAM-dependent methyltransferase [Clostridium thailandense]MBV7276216.1 class I SAM-dependent methyltransferase [Clostridium thailandense]
MELSIQNYWNNRAKTFSQKINEDMNSFKKETWAKIIKDKVADKDKVKVLDIGTGPGFFAIIMAQMGYDVTAVDCSDTMLQEAKGNAELAGVKVNFIKSDGEELNFQKESFDLIVSRNVTWTLKEPEKAYKNWFNLLKEDGRVVIFDANWYLRLVKPELKEEYEKNMELAKDMGHDFKINERQREECENIAKNIPMTYKLRPEWDKEALTQCGFKKIIIEKDISDSIYTEEEKIAHKTTPMFSICACKL